MNHPYTYQYQAASTSQMPLSASDVPDLYYEQGYRTPSSVTSLDMLSTPPRHFQTPWMQEYHNDVRENGVSYMSSWQSSPMDSCQSKRPTVAPIDTNFTWSLHDTTDSSPMHYNSNGEFNRSHQVARGHHSSYPQTFVDNDPSMSLSLNAMPDSSALSALLLPPIASSSSISDPYTITPPSHQLATTTNQAPLKLHQPRPSRRIPIISLSNLASACDDFAISTHVKEPKRQASEEVPSPVSTGFNRVSYPVADGRNNQHLKYMLYPANDMYSPTFAAGFDGHCGKAILCNCGCMESYTFR
ncbi:hypothetical protein BYT27DRAFT_7190084 [Phlegmacium glaucopus]|nr:hypothetical protein BYT27DRAFT_7190084 [Phlegmacium glaucopus]